MFAKIPSSYTGYTADDEEEDDFEREGDDDSKDNDDNENKVTSDNSVQENSVQDEHLQHGKADTCEYDDLTAKPIESIMVELSKRVTNTKIQHEHQFLVTYSLKKGIQKVGEKGRESTLEEMKQMHDQDCFEPIDITTLNPVERKIALESLIFVVEKKTLKRLMEQAAQRTHLNVESAIIEDAVDALLEDMKAGSLWAKGRCDSIQ